MTLPTPAFTETEVHALRAFLNGTADTGQMIMARKVIGEKICHALDSPYVANGTDRETFIMIGRHQVWILIASALSDDVLEAARNADKPKATRLRAGRAQRQPE